MPGIRGIISPSSFSAYAELEAAVWAARSLVAEPILQVDNADASRAAQLGGAAGALRGPGAILDAPLQILSARGA
eukprot:2622287-Pyramimonas_sp.AAC.1